MSEFGNAGDPGNKNFGDNKEGDQPTGQSDGVDITPEELAELRKRDVNAQTHIPRLETENETMRTKLAELESQLEGSATLQDVLNRIENKANGDTSTVDPAKLAEQVEARLQAKAQETVQETNFNKVFDQLKETHGSAENVDNYVLEKGRELGMDSSEATRLARTSPDAFMKLFANEGTKAPQQGTASAGGQTNINNTNTSGHQTKEELKAMYDEMMHKNPRKYWKPETQAALYRDVYGVGQE